MSDQKILECIPNFNEGKDVYSIKEITDEIQTVKGVKVLNIDIGQSVNRTVVTIAGEPDAVVEAAFIAIKKATSLIDMTQHQSVHPRIGATDVCPLVPLRNMSMEETVEYARALARRVGDELKIPVYCYGEAAFTEERKNLAHIRSGKYEKLKEKVLDPAWKPDFGPAEFIPETGAIAVGARGIMVAYNINLDTNSIEIAREIASELRKERELGKLVHLKALGWYLEDYNITQISMNLTCVDKTPLHLVFDKVKELTKIWKVNITGSEIVGLIPHKCLLAAGKYFYKQQGLTKTISEYELLNVAVHHLGLNDIYPFDTHEKILDYQLQLNFDQD